ncbi:NAD(P)/FAD-dependent oxidoreductase [Actinomycetospora sp. CA-101289]|uniref:NAD(P)/FAD-dependent oxidoreductase n=1 Tax=Actinomycetospora sp. CA-101289 TaxID=3239893 RepID=UPI003D9843A6
MTEQTDPGADVVVVGAGVIGLTSAIRLAEAGHRVRVLTDRPIDATTSVAAGAMLGISGAGPGDPLTTWTERSTAVFDELAQDPASGIRHRHGRIHVDVADEIPPWARVLPDFRALRPDELRGFRTGMAVTLPFADMPTYLAHLAQRAERLGVAVEQGHVADLAELGTGPVVVNAAGSRAGELAGDPAVTGVRGVHVVLTDACIEEFTMEIAAAPRWTNVFPHPGRIVVGGAALPPDDDTPDAEVAEEILARATAVEPRLADARVLGHEVGWRPVRPTPRAEVDDRGVVHAYGHGGVGVTVSWGVADEVTGLVASLAG